MLNVRHIILKWKYVKGVYIYTKVIDGAGGLPTGTGGKTLLQLSGGIDSPVAGMEMMKRGVK